MEFEWDSVKNQQNIDKHGIDFRDAQEVFEKPMLVRQDERNDYGEDRWIALGDLKGIIVVMVFVLRGEVIRIVSMRKGNKDERQIYQDEIDA